MSPTARSLSHLRHEGYLAAVVERWNPWAKVRQDLYGFIDIVAVKEGERGVLAIQATSATNASSRTRKAQASPNLRVWLASGNQFEVWGWGVKGELGQQKTWRLERHTIHG